MSFHGGLKTQGFLQGIYEQSSVQKEELGTIRVLKDGRTFAYALAGATALGAGALTQGSAPDSNAHNEAIAASASIGAKTLTITFGGAVTANFYKDGYLHVNDATGEGHAYRIKAHPAGTSSVLVDLYDPIRVALTASTSEITLTANIQSGVIIHGSPPTAVVAGVPPIAVTAAYYFWNQVKGWAAVLTEGTVVIGQAVVPSTATDGAVAPLALTEATPNTGGGQLKVGTVMQVNATTEYSLINLGIPGY